MNMLLPVISQINRMSFNLSLIRLRIPSLDHKADRLHDCSDALPLSIRIDAFLPILSQ